MKLPGIKLSQYTKHNVELCWDTAVHTTDIIKYFYYTTLLNLNSKDALGPRWITFLNKIKIAKTFSN